MKVGDILLGAFVTAVGPDRFPFIYEASNAFLTVTKGKVTDHDFFTKSEIKVTN